MRPMENLESATKVMSVLGYASMTAAYVAALVYYLIQILRRRH